MLAILLNYSTKFKGRKVKIVYLLVITLLFGRSKSAYPGCITRCGRFFHSVGELIKL